jgi:hypothetical protein
VAAALLAYPVWFALEGPAHLSGPIWPSLTPGLFGIDPGRLYRLVGEAGTVADAHRFGGYQGVGLHQGEYLGVGLIVVVVAGLLLWRRDRRLWLFGALGVVSVSLSLSLADFNGWVPWRWLRDVPVVQSVLPARFMAMTYLAAGVMLGITVDRCRRWLLERQSDGRRATAGRRGPVVAGGAAVLVALVALVPMTGAYAASLPLTVVPVVLPEWFTAVAPHLPPGQVVLAYPSSYGGFQAVETWQAVDRMSYSEMEGAGPTQSGSRAGAEAAGDSDLGHASLLLPPESAYAPATIAAVRQAILHAGVTRVVIPDQPELPLYEQGLHPSYAVGLMTAALGTSPRMEARAWVWTPSASVPALSIPPSAFAACVTPVTGHPALPGTVPRCMLAATGR